MLYFGPHTGHELRAQEKKKQTNFCCGHIISKNKRISLKFVESDFYLSTNSMKCKFCVVNKSEKNKMATIYSNIAYMK